MNLHTVILLLVLLVTPANRPRPVPCPCGGAAIVEHDEGICVIECRNCKGALCVVGADARVDRVMIMWEQRQRGFRDERE